MLPSIDPESPPPAFGLVVYLRDRPEGGVTADVVNLDHGGTLTIDATDDRAALGKIVPAFRRWLTDHPEATPIDPPPKPDATRRRFLPVHG